MLKALLFVLAFCIPSGLGLYSKEDEVTILSAAEFQQRIISKGEIWLVKFYNDKCPHCVSMAPAFKEVANASKGIFNLGVVDIATNPKLSAEYASNGVPTILLFNVEKKPLSYDGARKPMEILQFVQNAINGLMKQRLGIKDEEIPKEEAQGTVVVLTDYNFDSELAKKKNAFWLVEFFAPWCGHCKSLEPEWKKAAKLLKGHAIIAALDATVHSKVSSRFAIQGFPTIKAFYPNDHENPKEYNGPRTGQGIADWVIDQLGATLEPPSMIELISQKEFELASSKTVCVIAFLPHLLDCQSHCRNGYVKMLQEIAVGFQKNEWGWLWTEGLMFPELEDIVGVGGFGYPALVALSSKKNVYAIFKGSFTKDGVSSFLREISYGRGSTIVLPSKVPVLNETIPWDGKDFEYPEESEEDDEPHTPPKEDL